MYLRCFGKVISLYNVYTQSRVSEVYYSTLNVLYNNYIFDVYFICIYTISMKWLSGILNYAFNDTYFILMW